MTHSFLTQSRVLSGKEAIRLRRQEAENAIKPTFSTAQPSTRPASCIRASSSSKSKNGERPKRIRPRGSEAGNSSDENDLVQAIRRGASDTISQTGRHLVGRSLNIQPTITVRPGFPVRVIVTGDLILEPYRG